MCLTQRRYIACHYSADGGASIQVVEICAVGGITIKPSYNLVDNSYLQLVCPPQNVQMEAATLLLALAERGHSARST